LGCACSGNKSHSFPNGLDPIYIVIHFLYHTLRLRLRLFIGHHCGTIWHRSGGPLGNAPSFCFGFLLTLFHSFPSHISKERETQESLERDAKEPMRDARENLWTNTYLASHLFSRLFLRLFLFVPFDKTKVTELLHILIISIMEFRWRDLQHQPGILKL
jgi:hypothetical protein